MVLSVPSHPGYSASQNTTDYYRLLLKGAIGKDLNFYNKQTFRQSHE